MSNYKVSKKLNYDTETPEKQALVNKLIDVINTKMLEMGYSEATSKDRKVDYVFSVGGDGTMLHSMNQHVNKNSVVVGINAGNIGFMTPYTVEDALDGSIFEIIKSGNTRVEKRSILQSEFVDGTGKVHKGVAVNDYAVTAEDPNEIIEFSIEVETHGHVSRMGRYRANAVVISGPCGSTAYNMSSGGAIIDPAMRCMQVVMVAPLVLGTRPIVVGKTSTISVKFHTRCRIYDDGVMAHKVSIPKDEVLKISLMKKESKVLVPEDWNFYSVLSKKLHWNNGQDV